MLDSMIILFGSLYFMHSTSKNWLDFGLTGYAFQLYGLLASFMLPESPKWLIEQKQYSDAETSLKTIAKWNGKTLKL